MNVKFRWGMTPIVAAAVAATMTAAVLTGVPALAEGSAHPAAPAALATPIVKSGFKNGPVTVPGTNYKTVASMSLAKGSWAIFGKAWLHAGDAPVVANCTLVAGADFDGASAALEFGQGSAMNQSIALNVAHTFGVAGSVRMQCNSAGGGMSVNYIKITAIQAGTLTTLQLP